jgi:hypothetical protein
MAARLEGRYNDVNQKMLIKMRNLKAALAPLPGIRAAHLKTVASGQEKFALQFFA